MSMIHVPAPGRALMLWLLAGATCAAAIAARPAASRAGVTPGASSPPVGTIPAHFDVSATGAARYSVALQVPPGTGGVQPALTLTYDSQQGNGMAGVGWALGGLSAVSRCGAILAVDGFAGTVAYDADDRFCLDGQRLIAVSGTYGADGAVYHTEVERWKRVVSNGACGSGPCSFTVSAPDGSVLQYGATADSRALAGAEPTVRMWAASSLSDRNGNALAISYTSSPADVATGAVLSSPGQIYPLRIDYTAGNGVRAARQVRFGYQARPDTLVMYVGGSPVTTAARLVSVATYLDSLPVKQYRLMYETGPGTGRSRLTSLAECDSDAPSAACLPATRFGWQSAGGGFGGTATALSGAFTISQGWTPADQFPRTAADVNGDGRMDLVGFMNGVQVALASPVTGGAPSFGAPTTWAAGFGGADPAGWSSEENTPRYLADVNGDRLPDVVGFALQGVRVGLSTGSAFTDAGWNQSFPYFQYPVWDPALYPRRMADVNGDGLTDLVGFRSGVQVALSQGDGFAVPATWISGFSYDQGNWTDQTPRELADVNGDGRADVVGFGIAGVQVALSTGTGFSTSGWDQGFPYFAAWDPTLYPIVMADMNGDRLTDIVGFRGGVQVALSTGAGFLPPAQWMADFSFDVGGWTGDMPRQMADVNGDRMADVVGFGRFDPSTSKNQVRVALSTGRALTQARWNQESLPGFDTGWDVGDNPRVAGDVNGDGLMDVLGFGTQNVVAGLSVGPFPDLVGTISNGLGGVYEVAYTALSDTSVYTEGGASAAPGTSTSLLAASTTPAPLNAAVPVYPLVRGGGSYVVARYTLTSDTTVNAEAFSHPRAFRYAGARLDLRGRGWLGFQTVSRIHPSTGKRRVSTYNQAFPLTGALAGTQTFCDPVTPVHDPLCAAPGTLLNQESYTYCEGTGECGAAVYQPYPGVYQVLRTGARRDVYTYGRYDYSLGKAYGYDGFGDPTLLSELGYVSAQGGDLSPSDNVYTCGTFTADTTDAWRIGFATSFRRSATAACASTPPPVCTAAPAWSAGTDLSVGATTYTTDGRMNVAARCEWDDVNARWATTAYGYDAYGNEVARSDPGEGTVRTAYDSVYHTFPATRTYPANANGVSLRYRYGHDPRFGTDVARTDPNGNTTVKCLDTFGRHTATQGPVPQLAGVASSPSCVPAQVTGGGGFAAALVITLTTHAWAADGNRIYKELRTLQRWPTAADTAPTGWQRRYVDGMARIYGVLAETETPGTYTVSCVDLDAHGRARALSAPAFTSDESPVCPADARFAHTAWDVYGRVARVAAPFGAADGTVTEISYPDAATAVYSYAHGDSAEWSQIQGYRYFGAERRLVAVTVPADDSATTRYGYDRLGRQVSATDPPTRDNPNGVTTTTAWDALGRVVATADPDQGPRTTHYALNGAPDTLVDALGRRTVLGYDAMARLLTKTLADGTVESFAWDDPSSPNGLGVLTSVSSAGPGGAVPSAYTYGYDRYGNRSTVALAVDGAAPYVMQTVYDPQGRTQQFTYPDGSVLETEYDDCCGQVSRLVLDGVVFARYGGYDAMGNPGIATYGNGVTTTYRYTSAGQLTGYGVTDAAGAVLQDDSLAVNRAGQVTAVVDRARVSGGGQQFGYDAPGRLVSAAAPGSYGTASYRYDASENLTQQGDVEFAYQAHRLVRGTRGGATVLQADYDGNGNLVRKAAGGDTLLYAYDVENHLTSVRRPGAADSLWFTYDYTGSRLRKGEPDGTVTLYVGTSFEVVTLPGGGVRTVRYVAGPYGRVATVTTGVRAPAPDGVPSQGWLFLHSDYLSSVVMTTDYTGRGASSRVAYTPYGSVFALQGPDDFRPKFTGKERDLESGLYYFGARYYDASLGRFITPDPGLGGALVQPGSFNRYAYVFNRPTTMVDPDGQAAIDVIRACTAFLIGSAALFFTASAAVVTTTVGAFAICLINLIHLLYERRQTAAVRQRRRDDDDERGPLGGTGGQIQLVTHGTQTYDTQTQGTQTETQTQTLATQTEGTMGAVAGATLQIAVGASAAAGGALGLGPLSASRLAGNASGTDAIIGVDGGASSSVEMVVLGKGGAEQLAPSEATGEGTSLAETSSELGSTGVESELSVSTVASEGGAASAFTPASMAIVSEGGAAVTEGGATLIEGGALVAEGAEAGAAVAGESEALLALLLLAA